MSEYDFSDAVNPFEGAVNPFEPQEGYDFANASNPFKPAKYPTSNTADADDSWQITKGFKAGIDQVQAMGGGLLAATGDAFGSEDLRQYGLDIYEKNMEEALENAGRVQGFTDIGKDGNYVSDFTDWAFYTAGNMAPMLATSLIGGGVGGAVAHKAANAVAMKAASKMVAKTIGAAAGAAGTSIGMETGSIYGDIQDSDHENRAGVAFAHGAVAGALDALPVMRILNRAGIGEIAGDAISDSVMKFAGKQVLSEGITEGLQSIVEQHAKYWVDDNQNKFDIDWKQVADSAAAGSLMGGLSGGATAKLYKSRTNEEITAAREEAKEQGGDALDQTLAGNEALNKKANTLESFGDTPEKKEAIKAAQRARMDKLFNKRNELDGEYFRRSKPVDLSQPLDFEKPELSDAGIQPAFSENGSEIDFVAPEPGEKLTLQKPQEYEGAIDFEGDYQSETDRLAGNVQRQIDQKEFTDRAVPRQGLLPRPSGAIYSGGPVAGNAKTGMDKEAFLSYRTDSDPMQNRTRSKEAVARVRGGERYLQEKISDAQKEQTKIERQSRLPKGFTDERWLREETATRPAYKDAARSMVNALVKGGNIAYVRDANDRIVGRTPSENPPWAQSIMSDEGVSTGYIKATIEKATKPGVKLTEKQGRIVSRVLDQIEGEYEDPANIAHATEQRQKKSALRKAIREENERMNNFEYEQVNMPLLEPTVAELQQAEFDQNESLSQDEIIEIDAVIESMLLDIPESQIDELSLRHDNDSKAFADSVRQLARGKQNNEQQGDFNAISQEAETLASREESSQGNSQQADERANERNGDERRAGQSGITPTVNEPDGSRREPDEQLEDRTEPLLSSYSEQDLQERETQRQATEQAEAEQEAKAEADSQVDDFQLTGSDRQADADPNQGDIFDSATNQSIKPTGNRRGNTETYEFPDGSIQSRADDEVSGQSKTNNDDSLSVETTLKTVADNWESLRAVDVQRLIDTAINTDSEDHVADVIKEARKQRPDLRNEIDDAFSDWAPFVEDSKNKYLAARARVAMRKLRGDALKEQVKAKHPDIVGAQLHNGGGLYAFILPDASEQDRFRLTNFDENGFSGHSTFDTAEQALDDAIRSGYREMADGALESMSQKDSFKAGNEWAAKIQQINSGQITWKELVESRTDQETKPETYAGEYDALWNRLNNVEEGISKADVISFVESIRDNKDAVIEQLSKLTKPKLERYYNGYRAKDLKKDRLVKEVYEDLATSFKFLTTDNDVMVISGTGISSPIQDTIDKLTEMSDEAFMANLEKRKEKREARQADIKSKVEGMKDPKTLEDFRNAVRAGRSDKFTPEQWATYDRLHADARLERQAESRVKTVESVDGDVNYSLHEGKHTQKGHDLFIVSLNERVDGDLYRELNNKAKQLGGYYSRYSRDGAIPGFQFKSEEARKDFLSVLEGDSVEKTKQYKDQTESLLGLAERMEARAEEALGQDRKTNTARRANMAAGAIANAEGDLAIAAEIRVLAEAIQAGEAKYLARMTAGTERDAIAGDWNALLSLAQYSKEGKELREQNIVGGEARGMKWKKGVTPEQKVRFAEYPLSRVYKDSLTRVANDMISTKGYKLAGQQILKLANKSKEDKVYIASSRHFDKFREFVIKHQDNSYLEEMARDYNRYQKMGIETLPMLRAALLEYDAITDRAQKKEVKTAVSEQLKYSSFMGKYKENDFFNTTKGPAKQVVELADLEEGMSVLEPSAGLGHLARAAAELVGQDNVTVNELAYEMHQHLEGEGFKGTHGDFLTLEPTESYDRVVMNPPFSKDQEITHIEHAYQFLKPGGRLVAITSSMAGERSNKRNKAFKEWLDELGADQYPLPEGSFKDAINSTGVNTKIIVIDKPLDGGSQSRGQTTIKESIGSPELRSVVDDFMSYYNGNIPIEPIIVEKQEDAYGPEGTADKIGRIEGAYHAKSGKVVLVSSAIRDASGGQRVLRHELLGHYGLNTFNAQDKKALLERLISTKSSKEFAAEWAQAEKLYHDKTQLEQAEEVFAFVAEKKDDSSQFKKLVDLIAAPLIKLLRKAGLVKVSISRTEVRQLVRKISKGIKDGTRTQQNFPAHDGAQFSRADTDVMGDSEAEALEKLGLSPKQSKTITSKVNEIVNRNWKEAWKAFKGRAYEGMFDGLAGLKEAEKAAGVTNNAESGYVGARLATGVADTMTAILNYGAPEWREGILQYKEGTRGLLDIFGDLEHSLTDWLAWMGGMRAQELMDQGREQNLTQADIDALKAKASGKEELFERVRQDYIALNRAMLDMSEQAGLIEPGSRQKWESDYYVPFYRQSGEDGNADSVLLAPRTKRGLSHQSAGIKALKGGDIPTNDLLENILTNWIKLTDSAMKNSALLKTVDNLQNTDYLSNESMRYVKQAIPKSELNKRIRTDRKYKEMVADFLGESRDAKVDKLINQVAKLDSEGYELMWAVTAPVDPDVIRVTRNGKNEYYRVNDPALLRSVTHLNSIGSQDPITKTGRYFKRLLTTGVTASPDFILRNFIRDAVHAWAINPDGFAFGKDSFKGLKHALKEDADYRALMFSGASFQGGYVHGTDPESSAHLVRRALEKKGLNTLEADVYENSLLNNGHKLKNAVERGWQTYRNLGDKVENANRLATFKAALEQGKPLAQAVFESKDLMDYSLRGNFAALQWFTDVIPFLNARMQGLSKLGRAAKENPRRVFMQAGMKIVAFSVALAYLNDDDERYQELPDWDKDANWHFFIGDEHWRAPKPFELGIVFGTMPERMFHTMAGNQSNEKLLWSLQHNLFHTLNVYPIPQFVMPIAEVVANKSFFFGTPIEGMADEGKLTEARYNERTSSTMKELGALSKWIGVSPKELEHLWNGYLGTMGMYALGAADILINRLTGRSDRPEWQIEDLPVFRSFYKGSGPAMSTQYMTDVYDRMKEVDEIARTIKAYQKEGLAAEAKELIIDNKDKLRYRRSLNKARKDLSNINRTIDQISRSKMLSARQKREKMDKLRERKNMIAKQFAELTETAF